MKYEFSSEQSNRCFWFILFVFRRKACREFLRKPRFPLNYLGKAAQLCFYESCVREGRGNERGCRTGFGISRESGRDMDNDSCIQKRITQVPPCHRVPAIMGLPAPLPPSPFWQFTAKPSECVCALSHPKLWRRGEEAGPGVRGKLHGGAGDMDLEFYRDILR